MTTLTCHQQLNMFAPPMWEGDISSYSGSHITIADATHSATYYGTFYYNDYGLSGGTVTDYVTNHLGPEYEAHGMSLDALAVYAYEESDNMVGLIQYALEGNDTVNGSAYGDALRGWNGSDLMYGNGGNDTLNGEYGNDTLFGGDGNDSMTGGDYGDDYLQGNMGNDTVIGGVGNDRVYGGDGNDILRGGWATDYLTGGNGNDTIFAGKDNDTLTGGLGNDVFDSRLGNDEVTGGSGSDIFLFASAPNGSSNVDTIIDFTPGEDEIWLNPAIFTALAPQTGNYVSAVTYLSYDSISGMLSYDADGAGGGAAVPIADIGSFLTLTFSDLMVSGY